MHRVRSSWVHDRSAAFQSVYRHFGPTEGPAVKCGPADLRMLTRVKCGLIMRIFRCGFTGKMRIFCAVYSAEAGLLLRTKDCIRLR